MERKRNIIWRLAVAQCRSSSDRIFNDFGYGENIKVSEFPTRDVVGSAAPKCDFSEKVLCFSSGFSAFFGEEPKN